MGRSPRKRDGSNSPVPLVLLDWLLTLFVLSPLCVLFWRGTWQAIDCLDLPGPTPYGSFLVSAFLGCAVSAILTYAQEPVRDFLVDRRQPLALRVAVSRTFTAVFAFAVVNQWRGVWQLLEFYCGKSWQASTFVAAAGVALLAAGRTLRNIISPPLMVVPDVLDVLYCRTPTMLKAIEAKRSPCYCLMDVTVSVVVISSLVVFAWRGIWTVLDIFLYPTRPVLSAWISLAIGYGIVLWAYSLQFVAAAASRRLASNAARIAFEDAFLLVASFGAINVWRGIWTLADIYIYPEDYFFSNWLTAVCGLCGSVLLFAGNTVLAKGVSLDGDLKDGSGCIFHCEYLRKIIKSSQRRPPPPPGPVTEDGHAGKATTCVLPATGKANGNRWWGVVNADSASFATAERLLRMDGGPAVGSGSQREVITERETVV